MKHVKLFQEYSSNEGFGLDKFFKGEKLEDLIKKSKKENGIHSYIVNFNYKEKDYFFEFTEIDRRPKDGFISPHMKPNMWKGVYSINGGDKKDLGEVLKLEIETTIKDIVENNKK